MGHQAPAVHMVPPMHIEASEPAELHRCFADHAHVVLGLSDDADVHLGGGHAAAAPPEPAADGAGDQEQDEQQRQRDGQALVGAAAAALAAAGALGAVAAAAGGMLAAREQLGRLCSGYAGPSECLHGQRTVNNV